MSCPPSRFLPLLSLACSTAVLAQSPAPLQVQAPWVRASASATGTGAFMRLTASEPLTLVGVSSPDVGVAEIHEMRLDGDIMRMRAVTAVELPAGQTVELRPGGYHLMLMDLKAPMKADTLLPLTLLLRDAQGKPRRLLLQVPVLARAPGAAARSSEPAAHTHGKH